eukprot:scaffold4445_cov262-Chaetoceros_neogracile.AAC.15
MIEGCSIPRKRLTTEPVALEYLQFDDETKDRMIEGCSIPRNETLPFFSTKIIRNAIINRMFYRRLPQVVFLFMVVVFGIGTSMNAHRLSSIFLERSDDGSSASRAAAVVGVIASIKAGEPPTTNNDSSNRRNDNPDSWWKGMGHDKNVYHPHIGARHTNGSLQMIINPSIDRLFDPYKHRNDGAPRVFPINSEILCPTSRTNIDMGSTHGIEQEGGYKALQKIKGGIQKFRSTKVASFANTTGNSDGGNNSTRKSKIMCMIYTVHLPNDNHTNLRAQAATWGQQCDGFFAASNYTDHSIGAIDLPHAGPEEYGNMWQKIRTMWAYAYDHFKDDYDFFHIGGDDIYVAVDNLRAYVDGPEMRRWEDGELDTISRWHFDHMAEGYVHATPRPLILGTPMSWKNCLFPSGGPGYTLNRAALDLFGTVGLATFLPDNYDSREDVFMGSFFNGTKVYLTDTRDQQDNSARYGGSAEKMYLSDSKKPGPDSPKMLAKVYGIVRPDGLDNVSHQYIAFHLKDDKDMLLSLNRTVAELIHRYHAILYDLCV